MAHTICDACCINVSTLAIDHGREWTSLTGLECRECDLDICEYCVQDPSRFIK